MRTILFKKTTSLAVFDPGFSAGRWANAEVGTWVKYLGAVNFLHVQRKKKEVRKAQEKSQENL